MNYYLFIFLKILYNNHFIHPSYLFLNNINLLNIINSNHYPKILCFIFQFFHLFKNESFHFLLLKLHKFHNFLYFCKQKAKFLSFIFILIKKILNLLILYNYRLSN